MRASSTSTMIMMISFISVMSLSCSSLSVTSSVSLISIRVRSKSIVIDSSRKPSDTTYLNLFYSTRVLLL